MRPWACWPACLAESASASESRDPISKTRWELERGFNGQSGCCTHVCLNPQRPCSALSYGRWETKRGESQQAVGQLAWLVYSTGQREPASDKVEARTNSQGCLSSDLCKCTHTHMYEHASHTHTEQINKTLKRKNLSGKQLKKGRLLTLTSGL